MFLHSWDHMAQYDLPATIYYILNQTSHQQLYYVGHSQGTAIGFARFSEDQALASRVKHFMALAPIGRVGHITSPVLRFLVQFAEEIEVSCLFYVSTIKLSSACIFSYNSILKGLQTDYFYRRSISTKVSLQTD